MALERSALLLSLVIFGYCWADQPQSQALRSFSDRHQDKFNGNSYEPMDSQVTPKARSYPSSSEESYNSRPSRVRTSPMSRYGPYDQESIHHRLGDVAATYADQASYPTQPISKRLFRLVKLIAFKASAGSVDRKTFASVSKTGNLAMVVTPLAGIAFIAAAAAVAISPVYLTLSSSLLGRRKKRDLLSMIDPSLSQHLTPDMVKKVQELQVSFRVFQFLSVRSF